MDLTGNLIKSIKMSINKEINEISLPITEPEYRQMPELSYSTLSTYEKTGYDGLEHLFDKKESPALTFGSIVDAIITGGEDEFNKLFFVADFPSIGEKEQKVANSLFILYAGQYPEMESIPPTYILDEANNAEFQRNWKDETRVKVLTERCSAYYRLKKYAEGKTVIDMQTMEDAKACVRALRESDATAQYFADNDDMSPVRRYYQLKFKAVLEGVGYRCMADLIIVNYEKKTIYPCDLKTSGHAEWNFEQSFLTWQYMIQARLYWRIIKANLDKDPCFKDFKLEDYRFIVVNKKTLTPLVWEFPLTQAVGTLEDTEGRQFRDPYVIGKELRAYLDLRPPVPTGINRKGINKIKCLNKLND